jgi:uncharacterized protein YqgC (DUF456 family)
MLALLGVGVMAVAVLLIPLGIPGTWVMVAVLAAGAWLGRVSLFVLVSCAALALIAEVLEFMIVQRLNVKYGGSRLAFWGAIFGGIAGVKVGAPVPVIGSIIAGFIGSFVGAALATVYQTRQVEQGMRVGWGVLLGRMWAAATKVSIGIVIFVLGAAALLV